MTKEYFSESDINYICNKISNPFSNEIIHFQVYIKNLLQKIRKFLEQKRKSPNFKPDEFVKIVINHINSHKVAANTHVGILAAQSIGEPVTQSALSYFHKLAGDDTINGLKELYNITHNKTELSVVEFYLKPDDYDEDSKERILNSFKYINLKDIVLDVVYNGFNLRFYLYSHSVFAHRLHPLIIHQAIKQYLKVSKNILGKWDSSFNLENLYIEFKSPASKILDWLDSNGIEYVVEEDILCVYKVKENYPNNVINLESDDDYNDKYVLSDNEQNKNEWQYEENFHTQNKNDEERHIEIKNESNITNDSLLDYFKINNLKFEEKENYYILDSNYVKIKDEKIIKLLSDISLTGTKGVKTVSSKMLGEEEFYVEVVGRNLDPLFENQYIDLDRSRYTVYGTSKYVDHNTRKQNILEQLKRITNIDKSYYNNQHIELLTNFMCRNNTIVPMSRFGMKNDDYSFISKLSFEDPYSVLENILYGVKDSLSSVSAKIITGIYNGKI
ncbi:beta and beta-prime subunits of DNA dependent RNA-polymerase [Neocallimastix lanati (nom. inval.)]|nr:beta and beta-prime subunits of DNA dependent RNA-polymerase [Neocallimastix sp. JGI-2020a]KAG4082454.1 beta and beta-prime subunits of DNA dependent RNA-polymerase [Neocallimastix sp. JGI-2020a]